MIYWVQKGTKHTLYMQPKATLMTVVDQQNGLWLASCLNRVCTLAGSETRMKLEAVKWLKEVVLPGVISVI